MDENQEAQAKATKLLQPLLHSQGANGSHPSDASTPHHMPVTFRAAALALNALMHPKPKVSRQISMWYRSYSWVNHQSLTIKKAALVLETTHTIAEWPNPHLWL